MKIPLMIVLMGLSVASLHAMEPDAPQDYWANLPEDALFEIIMQAKNGDDALSLFTKIRAVDRAKRRIVNTKEFTERFIKGFRARYLEKAKTFEDALALILKLKKAVGSDYITDAMLPSLLEQLSNKFGKDDTIKQYIQPFLQLIITSDPRESALEQAIRLVNEHPEMFSDNKTIITPLSILAEIHQRDPLSLWYALNDFAQSESNKKSKKPFQFMRMPNWSQASFYSIDSFNAFITDVAFYLQQEPFVLALDLYDDLAMHEYKEVLEQWIANFSKNKKNAEKVKYYLNIKQQPYRNIENTLYRFGITGLSQYINHIKLLDITDENINEIKDIIKKSVDIKEISVSSFQDVIANIELLKEKLKQIKKLPKGRLAPEDFEAKKQIEQALDKWIKVALIMLDSGARPNQDQRKRLKKIGIKHPALEKKKK